MTATFQQLQTLFQQATVLMTGFTPKDVRPAYQRDVPPTWEIDQDVIYFYLTVQDDPYDKLRDEIYTGTNEKTVTVKYTEVLKVQWSCFGPNAFDNAKKIKLNVISQGVKNVLATQQIYPIPELRAPDRVPYPWNNRWWERSDIEVMFNHTVVDSSTVPLIVGVPVEMEAGGKDLEFTVGEH